MSLILKSKTRKGWVLKIGDPAGFAYLEINGLTTHLSKPYLHIRFIPGGEQTKVFSGYVVEGWFVAGWLDKPVTTIKFIQILKSLGFFFANGIMSANSFRIEITRDLLLEERENLKNNRDEDSDNDEDNDPHVA